MSRARSPRRRVAAPPSSPRASAFAPVPTRARHDGWTPHRQTAFIDALAQSGCIHEACASVGVSRQSAYARRARIDAQAFRIAWDAALDYAIRRLSDECLSRALNGTPVPHYFGGAVVGEHRRYDTRLALFLLRYRDPLRYAATLDQMVYSGHVEAAAIRLSKARDRTADEAHKVPDLPDDPDVAPFETVPLSEERARRDEDALIGSDAPLHGTVERRRRIEALRRARRVAEPPRDGAGFDEEEHALVEKLIASLGEPPPGTGGGG
ncbi:hypothetical protein Q4F19_19645 [Sphingomonas sp. BIUV-7]|uniref:Terminase small subunit n=1 Tax=Sphingomonas natans TaxID=3063330 RepID=A0ABT8YF61_9SPHN|nr:hypothetical protein [Sphingomonas sp. BIUV-7]MDO6416607.1 hypothetical protein [Sphingomonas sp. BIUV-7]